MSMKPIFGVLTILLSLAGCSLFGYNHSASTADLGEAFTLREGESVQLVPINASLRFVEKTADSRCPLGVTCFWEGEARISLSFALKDRPPASFDIVGHVGPEGGGTASTDTLGYRFTLLRLDPYPVEGHPNQGASTATLKVDRR